MGTSQAWAANIRRTCYIGDFRQCKHHGEYQKAFTRLLGNLQIRKANMLKRNTPTAPSASQQLWI